MYGMVSMVIVLLVLALALIHYRPGIGVGLEGFAVAAVDPRLMPACVERSTDAQAVLARIANQDSDAAAEFRLLVSKMCCMEADITGSSPGVYRTTPLQFRTSHDMEPASSLVARCLARAMPPRDVELIIEKFTKRGHELLDTLTSGCADAQREFDAVAARLRKALDVSCRQVQPTMDHPLGARDMGFWEPEKVAGLSQYQGVSAAPK
jgi:hypothetical protein